MGDFVVVHFTIFTGPEKKKEKNLPAACLYLHRSTLLFYFPLFFFLAFKESSQKSLLKGIRPHAGRSLPIMKWWEVEKLIFSLACIRRGVHVREQAAHANVAIETSAPLQLTS